MSERKFSNERFPIVDGVLLRLSFDPEAIRDHFQGDRQYPNVGRMSDAVLEKIGAEALQDDVLYDAFHTALCNALNDIGVEATD